jgi:hypothetical protein
MWSRLSRPDIAPDDPAYSEARRRVLARLGEYVALIVAPLNMRPTGAALLRDDDERIEVRISTAGAHVVLAIAPEGDLAAEVFFLRMLAGKSLPVPRLIAHDLASTLVPFTYAVQSYVGGAPLDRLEDGPLMRVAARQLGRTLRRAHQLAAPGFGRPTITGRWTTRTWGATLEGWLARRELFGRAEEALGAERLAALRAATLDHPVLACGSPYVIHGAVAPARALATVGDSAQLEALVRPGEIVGGDPLFDLAHGLLPRHAAAFRVGLLEGYTAAGALAPEQEDRLWRLRLLLYTADIIGHGEAAQLAQLPNQIDDALRSQAPSARA